MDAIRMDPQRQRRWFMYAVAIIVIVMVLGASWVALGIYAMSRGSTRGVAEDRNKWPTPLLDLLTKASHEHIDVEPVRVYRVVDFTEKYFYWRMKSSPELIALMTTEWQLNLGKQNDIDAFWRRWPDHWELSETRGHQTFLGNYRKPSDNFIVIEDDSQPVVYGFYYFNF